MNANKNVTNKFKNTTKHKVSKQISTAMYTIFLLQPQKEQNNIQTFKMPSKKEQENLQHCCCFFVFLNSLFKCEKLIISIN